MWCLSVCCEQGLEAGFEKFFKSNVMDVYKPIFIKQEVYEKNSAKELLTINNSAEKPSQIHSQD